MCRCCRLCWEDFYWNCIEEKFCFDEEIAKYNPEEDEYYMKKKENNGVLNNGLTSNNSFNVIREVRQENSIDNNNSPICEQPKLTNAEFQREIQTNVPILAPEVIAAFANSKIFHEHASSKLTSPLTSPNIAGVHKVSSGSGLVMKSRDADADELLKRLEDHPKMPPTIDNRRSSESPVQIRQKIPEIVEEKSQSDDKLSFAVHDTMDNSEKSANSSNTQSKEYLAPEPTYGSMNIVNKNLQLEAPYFSFRPASENDIFAITQPNSTSTQHQNRFSQTPEVPSVSFNTLPKNYLDTPTVEEYRESKSLYEIQTAGINQQADVEKYSMPRYYSKSHLFTKNTSSATNSSNESIKDNHPDIHRTPKRVEKSRRLKNIRMQLPPLMIGLDKSKEGKTTRG